MSFFLLNNNTGTPSAPASGKSKLYARTEKRVYFEDDAAAECVIDGEYFITTQGGTYTLTSQTAAQKLFNSPAAGALTLPAGSMFQFEAQFDLSSMSASSGSFGFAIGGTATMTFIKWLSIANKAALATAAADQSTVNVTAANTAIASATTNTVAWAYIRGLFRTNAAGTVIPQVSLGVAAAAVVGQDSFFRCWGVGTNTAVSVGPWA